MGRSNSVIFLQVTAMIEQKHEMLQERLDRDMFDAGPIKFRVAKNFCVGSRPVSQESVTLVSQCSVDRFAQVNDLWDLRCFSCMRYLHEWRHHANFFNLSLTARGASERLGWPDEHRSIRPTRDCCGG